MKIFLLICILFLISCASKTGAPAEAPVIGLQPPPPFSVELETPSTALVDSIKTLAGSSQCAKYSWKNRGTAPKGYIKGMALVYARAVCNQTRADVVLVSQARKLPESIYDSTDALSWYNSNFKALGMANDVTGKDTYRRAFTLLFGLGMRESSGEYCTGRDLSADFTSADSAEAGLFQASWGAHAKSAELQNLFDKYKNPQNVESCYLDVFKEGVSCKVSEAINWGSGTGAQWQDLTKKCPAFSAEYASILVRLSGGTKGEFGPFRNKAAEIRSECENLFKQVEQLILAKPEMCETL